MLWTQELNLWSERPCCVLDGKPYAFNIFCMVFKSNPKSRLSFCLCMLFQTFLLLFPFMLLDTKQDVPLCTVITEQNKTRNGVSINVKRKKKHWHFWGENVCRLKSQTLIAVTTWSKKPQFHLDSIWIWSHLQEKEFEFLFTCGSVGLSDELALLPQRCGLCTRLFS